MNRKTWINATPGYWTIRVMAYALAAVPSVAGLVASVIFPMLLSDSGLRGQVTETVGPLVSFLVYVIAWVLAGTLGTSALLYAFFLGKDFVDKHYLTETGHRNWEVALENHRKEVKAWEEKRETYRKWGKALAEPRPRSRW